jgi:hypothetical protein
MVNPYRKLFNLFAFSLLAFAVYLNFFRSDNDPLSVKSTVSYGQPNASSQHKPVFTTEDSKQPLAKIEKKN